MPDGSRYCQVFKSKRWASNREFYCERELQGPLSFNPYKSYPKQREMCISANSQKGLNVKASDTGRGSQERVGPSAAQPTVFGAHVGLFTAAGGNDGPKGIAALFLSPWGLEEFLTRKFNRYLADKFAEVGIASLRFDYPGTGNAVDDANVNLSAWVEAIEDAANELKELAGVSRILLVGQGLGAGLAYQRAADADDVAGLALLAPVFKGRGYLRELRVWSSFVNDGLGLKPEDKVSEPGKIAGLEMPPRVVADLKSFNLSETKFSSATQVLLARKPESIVDDFVTENLSESGCTIRQTVYRDFDTLLSENSPPALPTAFASELIDWAKTLPEWRTRAGLASRIPETKPIERGHYRETPLRFAENNRLFGTLCEPVGKFIGVTAVILSTSYDYQIGWARANVTLARKLAAMGIATLRYDGADIGDSPPVPGRRGQVLYDDKQIDDAELAYKYVESIGLAGKAMVIGRCSGAYAAFQTALRGPHWKGCVTINPYGFYWRFIGLPKPLKEYWSMARDPALIKRIIGGEVDLKAASVNVCLRLVDRIADHLQGIFPAAPKLAQRNGKVHAEFKKLAKYGTNVTVIYSEEDIAMEAFLINFGENSEGLKAYSNTKLHMVPNTDHNLTPKPAREKVFDIIEMEAVALAQESSA